jgi:hypothetical protein
MSSFNIRDWLVMALVTAAWLISTMFLFVHPDPANFATWAAFGATIIGCYHWLIYVDDKKPDAP